jgi:Protein of unknown function (DUF3108)
MTTATGFAPRWNQTRFLVPLVAYCAAAVVTTWPLAAHPRTLLGATSGPGDPYLNLWILGWDMQALLSNPASVVSGAVFNANIFYPAAGTLTYSDHLLFQSVLLAPLYALTRDVVLCYNVLLIASLVASAFAMHLFVRHVVCTEHGAYLAGFSWGFGSFHFAHLIHLQLQSLYFLPLTFLFLHRVIAGRRVRDVVLLGATAGLQAVSSVYYGVIGGLALVVGGLALAAGVGRWRNVAVLRRLIYSAAIAVVLILPIATIYARVAQREGFGRNLFEAARNAAVVSSYLQVPPGNVLYGRTHLLRLVDTPRATPDAIGDDAPPRTGPERELFPGFVLIALAIAGAWLGWRSDARPMVLSMGAVGLLGFVLSFGPDGVRPLYAALHRFAFGFAVIRAPARFSVLVTFALTAVAAVAIRELLAPRAPTVHVQARVVYLLIAVALLEWLHVPLRLAASPPLYTPVGGWLAREAGSGAVAILPLGLDADATPAMVQSLEHQRSIVNGYSGQRPAFFGPLADAINTFPSTDALAALHDSRVRFVVTPKPLDRVDPPVAERARFAEGTIYELRWTPELETRLAAASAVEPPPPGAFPFRVGERAEYDVHWDGAGVSLSAGDISIAVESPEYRFVVTATTAPWVARFFEAKDVFKTQADRELLPRVHERDQQEGSRHVSRAFVFDGAARTVRTGRTLDEALTSAAVVLPMAPHARDAISALFYVRTLPLRAGERIRFPVNEAGRNLVAEVTVNGIEHITSRGKSVEALRVTPLVQRRADDRQSLAATMWLSNDERRLPLVFDLEAGFGHVRVELVSYRP